MKSLKSYSKTYSSMQDVDSENFAISFLGGFNPRNLTLAYGPMSAWRDSGDMIWQLAYYSRSDVAEQLTSTSVAFWLHLT